MAACLRLEHYASLTQESSLVVPMRAGGMLLGVDGHMAHRAC